MGNIVVEKIRILLAVDLHQPALPLWFWFYYIIVRGNLQAGNGTPYGLPNGNPGYPLAKSCQVCYNKYVIHPPGIEWG